MYRRTFLKAGVAGFGSILLMPSCISESRSSWLFFTEAEAACVIALAEQIIPAVSSCGQDVMTMNTTYKNSESPNNIHFMSCTDCHDPIPEA